ncbi:adenosine receptor A2b-like [Actinia tenebrosa]|uniref:Adenosine receptor A2b-like n=1 Tax=Actinia tenebrosa TaxID=6105 RepID=A0A6P8IG94_ACTTE|nr:adenosine receptor A2b-like [Actinia tenebrosa]
MKYIDKCSSIAHDISDNFTSSGINSLIFLGFFNSVLAVPTAAANALVIVAILTTSSLRTPSYLLLTSLAFSDLVIGILGQSLLAMMIFSFFSKHAELCCYVLMTCYVILSWTSWSSLFTITAISVDRYLAVRLKMRYKTFVTVTRIRRIIPIIWISSFTAMASIFVLYKDMVTFGVIGGTSQTCCLALILFCYTMSFRALKIHCAQTHPQGNQQPNSATQSNAIDVLKYRKLLKTMIIIVILICVCYLPLIGIFVTVTAPGSYKSKPFRDFMISSGLSTLAGLVTTMTLNSTLSPIIYMTRMRDVRNASAELLRNICSSR